MAIKGFQSSFNPLTNYLWSDLTEHPDNVYKTLWITNLPPNTSEQEVRSFFEAVGSIVIVEVMKEFKTQTFAQITYRDSMSGILALCNLNNREFRDRNIHVSMYVHDAPSRRDLGVSDSVYLKELPDDLSTTELFFHLGEFGRIVNLQFLKKGSGPSKTARVSFLEGGDAQNAARCLNGSKLGKQRIFACPWRDRPSSRSHRPCSRRSTARHAVQVPLPAAKQIANNSIKSLPKPLLPRGNLPLPMVDTSRGKLGQIHLARFPPRRSSKITFLIPPLPYAMASSALDIPTIARFSANTTSLSDGLAEININVASSVLRNVNNIPWASPPVNLTD